MGEDPGMEDREALTALRALVVRNDGPGLVARLQAEPWPDDCLQLVGDGLLVAIRDRVDGSVEPAHALLARLRERGWAGDQELIEALDDALGSGPAPLLRPLPVDLEELAMILEGDPVQGGGRIDLVTGEVWPQAALDYAQEIGEETEEDDESDRWLWVNSEGSRDGYRDMEWFIEQLDDPGVTDRLMIAIEGRGAFRRFKDTLSRWPDLMTRWHAFSAERHRGRSRRWLAEHGYTPVARRT